MFACEALAEGCFSNHMQMHPSGEQVGMLVVPPGLLHHNSFLIQATEPTQANKYCTEQKEKESTQGRN